MRVVKQADTEQNILVMPVEIAEYGTSQTRESGRACPPQEAHTEQGQGNRHILGSWPGALKRLFRLNDGSYRDRPQAFEVPYSGRGRR